MRWIPIDKAKVKFGTEYLIASDDMGFAIGMLLKSETTASGIKHDFYSDKIAHITATHIAIITDPNK